MAELGINVLDANGKLRDMGDVMEEIGGKWGDLTREQQVYLAQTMAGQRQYNNLLALFDNFEQYNKALNPNNIRVLNTKNIELSIKGDIKDTLHKVAKGCNSLKLSFK